VDRFSPTWAIFVVLAFMLAAPLSGSGGSPTPLADGPAVVVRSLPASHPAGASGVVGWEHPPVSPARPSVPGPPSRSGSPSDPPKDRFAAPIGSGARAVADCRASLTPLAPAHRPTYPPSTATAPSVTVPGAPNITGVVPGAGNATVDWSPPSSGGPVVNYQVDWGVEGQHAFMLLLNGTLLTATLGPLLAGPHYVIQVAGENSGGSGPFSAPANLTLVAWSELRGGVSPTNATLRLDAAPLPVDAAGDFSVNTTPGAHVLLANAQGYFSLSKAVDLPWNGTASLALSLSSEPGAFAGVVRPPAANATWDSVVIPLGNGGAFRLTGAGGSVHVFNVSAPTFVGVSRTVTLPRNATLWLNVTLIRVSSALLLVVSPATAAVTVNGSATALDIGGRANLSLFPGTYPIEVTASGYLPDFRNVTLSTDRLNVSINLTPGPGGSSSTGGGFLGGSHPTWLYIALGILVLAAVLLTSAWLARRRAAQRVELVDRDLEDGRLYPLGGSPEREDPRDLGPPQNP